MVVLWSCPTVDTHIVVDGYPLPEYLDADESDQDRGIISVFVEAVQGAKFAVRCAFHDSFRSEAPDDGVNIEYTFDGIKTCQKLRPWKTFEDPPYLGYFDRDYIDIADDNGDRFRTDLSFQTTSLIDGDGELLSFKLRERLRQAGTIGVRIFRVKLERVPVDHRSMDFDRKSARASDYTNESLWSIQARDIPEKIVKGRPISHSISFNENPHAGHFNDFNSGRPRTTRLQVSWQDSCPIGTYRFKYLSRDVLENLLVIPRVEPRRETTVYKESVEPPTPIPKIDAMDIDKPQPLRYSPPPFFDPTSIMSPEDRKPSSLCESKWAASMNCGPAVGAANRRRLIETIDLTFSEDEDVPIRNSWGNPKGSAARGGPIEIIDLHDEDNLLL